MRIKKILLILCLCAGVCAGALCLFLPRDVRFDGERVASTDPPRFYLRFDAMNTEDAQTLSLTEGDVLHAAWQIEGGSVDVLISLPGEAPVYRADGRGKGDAADFDLVIPRTGDYTISVSAHKAKGWLDFTGGEK